MDQVISHSYIAEKHIAVDQKVFRGFMNSKKAFDRVVRKKKLRDWKYNLEIQVIA